LYVSEGWYNKKEHNTIFQIYHIASNTHIVEELRNYRKKCMPLGKKKKRRKETVTTIKYELQDFHLASGNPNLRSLETYLKL